LLRRSTVNNKLEFTHGFEKILVGCVDCGEVELVAAHLFIEKKIPQLPCQRCGTSMIPAIVAPDYKTSSVFGELFFGTSFPKN
jgi:transcription elongation factor Elf1